ncbi:glycosyl transferase family 2 [Asticcacaulis excentricus CB 48]|uniref:Glycosyl transferase family 2 n=1 Tax=Asticcacaulis excentricus (strain ATCC 15261 / DSM 4724 / KCTC 12464 / NCIMB 9791 / VKM B-1370 / CB 48) TaxID=573065 RepID=E8RMB2_ASTEC|nr:glycosyl transferase family 2 [Asticcacaulis excentricus CB 48]
MIDISIIIPTYNRSSRIKDTLLSVKNQTYSSFECIVVDDGSADASETRAVVESMGDPRFRYIYQANAGASKARNTGIDSAAGKFVCFLDSDDVFLPHKLERQYNKISEYKNALIFSQLLVDRGVEKKWIKPPRGPKSGERVDEYLMCTSGWMQTSTLMLNTNVARSVRFNEMLPSSQDTDFAIRCVNAGAVPVFIEEPLIVLNDVYDPSRVSKQTKYQPLLDWIENMRHTQISEKSYWGYRGWQCSRVASYSNKGLAVKLFFSSFIRGSYSAKQSIIILAQILISRQLYQNIATMVVRLSGK